MNTKVALTLLEPGTTWPNQYDWETYFALLLNENTDDTVTLDTGKVRGHVLTYIGLLDTLHGMAEERGEMMRTIGALLVENQELKDRPYESAPVAPTVELQEGMIVIVNATQDRAVIQFIEPGTDNIWINTGGKIPRMQHSHELSVVQ